MREQDLPDQLRLFAGDDSGASPAPVRGRAVSTLRLTRKKGEGFYIGDGPGRVMVVIERTGREPKLAISAPKGVPIRRFELPRDPRAA